MQLRDYCQKFSLKAAVEKKKLHKSVLFSKFNPNRQ